MRTWWRKTGFVGRFPAYLLEYGFTAEEIGARMGDPER